jgi:hypothetical protein
MYGTQLFPYTQMDAIFVGLELMDKLRRNQKNLKFSGSLAMNLSKKRSVTFMNNIKNDLSYLLNWFQT